MFIENEYLEEYYRIIKNNKIIDSKSQYCEKHHIIPKSLGGSNKKENTVYLSARDHFLCHKLLVKFTTGINNQKMWHALWRMMNKQSHSQQRDYTVTEEEYKEARINHSKIQSKRMSGENNPFYGKKHTDSTKKKMSENKKGKSYEEIFGNEYASTMREKRKIETTGKKRSSATKEKIRQNKLGKSRDPELMKTIGEKLRGRKQSPETIEKKRIAREAGKQTCEHCGGTFMLTNYKRWHGKNCKYANDIDVIQ
jgi:ribosomal protein S27AE